MERRLCQRWTTLAYGFLQFDSTERSTGVSTRACASQRQVWQERHLATHLRAGRFFLDPDCQIPDVLKDDQALWFNTQKGIVVLLGCAHAGVVNTVEYVAELTGAFNIHAVIGGMHLGSANQDRLRFTVSALQRYEVQVVAPCHCTGQTAMAYLAEHTGQVYRSCSMGHRFIWASSG